MKNQSLNTLLKDSFLKYSKELADFLNLEKSKIQLQRLWYVSFRFQKSLKKAFRRLCWRGTGECFPSFLTAVTEHM